MNQDMQFLTYGKKISRQNLSFEWVLNFKKVQTLDLVWTHLKVPLAYPRISSTEQTKTLQSREGMSTSLFEMEKFARILAQTACIGLGLDKSARVLKAKLQPQSQQFRKPHRGDNQCQVTRECGLWTSLQSKWGQGNAPFWEDQSRK